MVVNGLVALFVEKRSLILTNLEKIKTRIIVAHSVGLSPDEIRVVDCDREDGAVLYVLDKYKGHNLVLGFDKVPTKEEAKERIKDLYLSGVEWDFDDEFESI